MEDILNELCPDNRSARSRLQIRSRRTLTGKGQGSWLSILVWWIINKKRSSCCTSDGLCFTPTVPLCFQINTRLHVFQLKCNIRCRCIYVTWKEKNIHLLLFMYSCDKRPNAVFGINKAARGWGGCHLQANDLQSFCTSGVEYEISTIFWIKLYREN